MAVGAVVQGQAPTVFTTLLILMSHQAAAKNFSITTQQGTKLPTIVFPGTTAKAYYTVMNQIGRAHV